MFFASKMLIFVAILTYRDKMVHMKKETIKTEVINFLTNHRDGKSIEVIRQALSQPIDKRTLQRRLKELIESGV